MPLKTHSRRAARELRKIRLLVHPAAMDSYSIWAATPEGKRTSDLAGPEDVLSDQHLFPLPAVFLLRTAKRDTYGVIANFQTLHLIQKYKPKTVYLTVLKKTLPDLDIEAISLRHSLRQASHLPDPIDFLAQLWLTTHTKQWPIQNRFGLSQNQFADLANVSVDRLRRRIRQLENPPATDNGELLTRLLALPTDDVTLPKESSS